MKRIVIALSFGLAVAVATLTGSHLVGAAASSEDSLQRVATGQTRDSSWITGGQTVIVDGTVNGDVYCGSQRVVVSGIINGDLICGAQEIELQDNAVVTGSIRAAAQTLRIDGTASVGHAVSFFGQRAIVSKNAVVKGDLNGAVQELIIDGTVQRDVKIGSEQLTINGTIGRNIDANTDRFDIADTAKVGGDVAYTADSDLSLNTHAVAGQTTFQQRVDREDMSPVVAYLYGVIVLGLLVLVIVLLFPRFVHRASTPQVARLGLGLLVGFVTMIVLPIIAALMLMSIVLWPLGIAALLVWGLLWIMAVPLFAAMVGRFVVRQRHSNIILTTMLGVVILLLLLLIPIVNIIVWVLAFLTGAGLMILQMQSMANKPRYRVATIEVAPSPKTVPRKKQAAQSKKA